MGIFRSPKSLKFKHFCSKYAHKLFKKLMNLKERRKTYLQVVVDFGGHKREKMESFVVKIAALAYNIWP